MGWGADGSAFAVTGALFLLCGAIVSGPRVRASRTALWTLVAAASAFIVAAFLSRSYGGWTTSPWIWLVALLPLGSMAFCGARVLAERHATSTCVASQRSARRRADSAAEAAEETTSSPLRRAADPAASPTELADLAYAHPELRTVIASNPATPANVLGWLASSGDDAVADAIAGRGPEGPQRGAGRRQRGSEQSPGGSEVPPRGRSGAHGNARDPRT